MEGRWKSQNRKNVYLSPYVEEPLNSKVIKSFVTELRSRKCFSCFGIPMFYVYMLWTFYVRFTCLCKGTLQVDVKNKSTITKTLPKLLLNNGNVFPHSSSMRVKCTDFFATIHPHWPAPLVGLHRAHGRRFFQVAHTGVSRCKSPLKKCRLWVCPYFISSAQHVLLAFLR